MNTIQILSLIAFASVFVLTLSVFINKFKLELASKKGVGEESVGSSVCHGMTFKEGERGVNREQQPSYTSYKRLIN